MNLESKSNITKIVSKTAATPENRGKQLQIFLVNSITNAEIEEAVKKGLLWAKQAIEELGMKDDLTKLSNGK